MGNQITMAAAKKASTAEPTVDDRRYRFDVDHYLRLAEVGYFAGDERVELIEGEIIRMTPITPLHQDIVDRLNELISALVIGKAVVRVQGPVQLSDATEVLPDIAVLRRKDGRYRHGHPGASDILILIEVTDSNAYKYDRDEKIRRYAAAGVAEAWLIDVSNSAVEQFSQLGRGRYNTMRIIEHTDIVESDVLPVIKIAGAHIFGEE